MSRMVGHRLVAVAVTFVLSGVAAIALAPAAAAATTSSLVNPYVAQGQTHTITIKGSGYTPVALNVSVSPSTGVNVSNVAFVDSSTITATISAAVDAAVGARSVVVNQAVVDTSSCNGCLLITSPTSATPVELANSVPGTITVTGTGFDAGVTAVQLLKPSSPTPITATSVDVTSPSSLTAVLPLTGADIGRYVIQVSFSSGNPQYEGDTYVGGFVVGPPPTFASPAATPSSLPQGSSATSVVLHGTNFQSGATVAFSGSKVFVGDAIASGDGTSLTFEISIAGDAATGPRDITVVNPDNGIATAANAFTVAEGTSLSGAAPNNGFAGTTFPMAINGTGFTPGSTVTFSASGVSITAMTITSDSRIDLVVAIAPSATTGSGTVTVHRNGGGIATALFTVLAPDHVQRFVTDSYLTVLGRLPDRGGFDYFVSRIRAGDPHTIVANVLYASLEERRAIVTALFEIHLHRVPDDQGRDYYADQLLTRTIESIQIELTASQEYIAGRGGNDIDTYITAVYHDVLARDPDSAGLAYWHNQLAGGTPPWAVATGIIFSDEAVGRVVVAGYQTVLGRGTDDAGLAYWVHQIQQGLRVEQFLSLLIGSAEYDSHV